MKTDLVSLEDLVSNIQINRVKTKLNKFSFLIYRWEVVLNGKNNSYCTVL